VQAAVDFDTQIKPILESACLHCHNAEKAEGELRLDSLAAAAKGGDNGPALIPGQPAKSPLYALTVLPKDDEHLMPPEGAPLDPSQTSLLKKWIEEGAKWPADTKLEVHPRIDFVKNVQPILETNCLTCHSGDKPKGDFDLTTRKHAFETGTNPPALIPFMPKYSPLYALTILPADDPQVMPPAKNARPLPKADAETLRLWIAQGAIWPTNVTLKPQAPKPAGHPSPDDLALVQRLREKIIAQSKKESAFADYSSKVPKTEAAYHMVAIKGGDFLMGSPDAEPGRQPNEGPQTKVKLSPFWIGKYEVTWDEYEPFMITPVDRYKNGARKDYNPAIHSDVDAVTSPTAPYTEMSFGMGQRGFPAISMTQHGANKYCEWLSAQTGHFYRLPTEAEWEYACRAGTNTAYSFGDDPAQLGQYAWYVDNSEEKYHKVGKKKPNPWGLYDMHGNVMEWTADKYLPDYFKRLPTPAVDPFVRPDSLYPRTVRGGGWASDPEQLRSAFRIGSEAAWQQQDPQLPKSVWYLTDAQWLGFRLVRPKEIPSAEEMYFYWNSSTDLH
jgi:formylglycine-generating enzyme required for sulfatase activity